ncbi:hypothetical protein K501DRAFT_277564 [Backusella circina FSU 941]|nr:hypothetical protein K501DRAFT_277564 [Backusella circina FSU 941]
MSISNASYKVRSGMSWFKAIELKKKEETNIPDAYDKIPSPKSVHLYFFYFMKGYQHRERQGYMYSNMKVVLDFISNILINKTTTEELIMLVHTSCKSRRKKKVRKKHRGKKQLHQIENQRTVVAYGDANSLSVKEHSPAPVKFWNRDVNAAINIRDVLMYYLNSGFNVESQHPSLRHNKS